MTMLPRTHKASLAQKHRIWSARIDSKPLIQVNHKVVTFQHKTHKVFLVCVLKIPKPTNVVRRTWDRLHKVLTTVDPTKTTDTRRHILSTIVNLGLDKEVEHVGEWRRNWNTTVSVNLNTNHAAFEHAQAVWNKLEADGWVCLNVLRYTD